MRNQHYSTMGGFCVNKLGLPQNIQLANKSVLPRGLQKIDKRLRDLEQMQKTLYEEEKHAQKTEEKFAKLVQQVLARVESEKKRQTVRLLRELANSHKKQRQVLLQAKQQLMLEIQKLWELF